MVVIAGIVMLGGVILLCAVYENEIAEFIKRKYGNK